MVNLTVQDVLAAADTLEKISVFYDYIPDLAEWSPKELREEIVNITAAIEAEGLLDEIAGKLTAVLFSGYSEASLSDAFKDILRSYEIERPPC